MGGVFSAERKIDRLSTLPPELLTIIFDLAHDPAHPIHEPLSKYLLPYFRRNLYRQIDIDYWPQSTSSLPKLITTIQQHSSLASLTVSCKIDVNLELWGRVDIKNLLGHLPSLEFLHVHQAPSLSAFLDPLLCRQFPHLVSLWYGVERLFDSDLDLVSQLILRQLSVWFAVYEPLPTSSSSLSLETVEELVLVRWPSEVDRTLAKIPIGDSNLAPFVDRFTNLKSLALSDRDDPYYEPLLQQLDRSVLLLKSLDLDTICNGDIQSPCDHVLPRFSNLESLQLGDGSISRLLPFYLRQLPVLRSLQLTIGTNRNLEVEDLISLVGGSNRITTLQILVIDSVGYVEKGTRIVSEEDEVTSTWKSQQDHWVEPKFLSWTPNDLRRLMDIGRENGVRVSGSTFDAIPTIEAYRQEQANRIILESYQTKSLVPFIHATTYYNNDYLPMLDLASLDLDNLKLVKIDLPEENWYRFTLE